MHQDTFELVQRHVLYQKTDYPTNAYYQRLWVTLRDCAPHILAVVRVIEQDLAQRQRCLLTSADMSYVRECEQYVELHKEFLALVDKTDAYLQSRNKEQEEYMKFGEWRPLKGYLPALSISQPWAWLIANGVKDTENREWTTSYRGQVLIHAGKKPDENAKLIGLLREIAPEILDAAMHAKFETGGIVGIAILVDVVTSSTSPWFRGRYGFVLRDAKPLPFTAYRGTLGLFAVSESILEGDEATLRARNISNVPPRDLDNAYELTQAIEQAEKAQQAPHERPVFGDPTWIQRTRSKAAPGRCVIEVNGKRV